MINTLQSHPWAHEASCSSADGPRGNETRPAQCESHQVRDALIVALLGLLALAWFVVRLNVPIGIPAHAAAAPGGTAAPAEGSGHEPR